VRNSSKFIYRAADAAAHRGYQAWHHAVDKEGVAVWVGAAFCGRSASRLTASVALEFELNEFHSGFIGREHSRAALAT